MGAGRNGDVESIVDDDSGRRAGGQRDALAHQRDVVPAIEIAFANLNDVDAAGNSTGNLVNDCGLNPVGRDAAGGCQAPPISDETKNQCRVPLKRGAPRREPRMCPRVRRVQPARSAGPTPRRLRVRNCWSAPFRRRAAPRRSSCGPRMPTMESGSAVVPLRAGGRQAGDVGTGLSLWPGSWRADRSGS
jgi:hypothetical protein